MSPPVRAKSLQSCPTLCNPMDCSPPGSCLWNSPGKNSGVGCHVLQGIFPTQGSSLASPALAGRFFTTNATWEALVSPPAHLHFLISKEKQEEEAGPSLQGHVGPPGLNLPAPTVQGVADDVRFGGVEARVEVDGDIWPGVQAAAALEVHLEPGGAVRLSKGTSGQSLPETLKAETKPRGALPLPACI